jgi:uncharacterized protein YodC (DUF2158 family)
MDIQKEEDIVIGSTVQLKSGGPKMTVRLTNSDTTGFFVEVKCSWFDNNQVFEHWFVKEQLILTKPFKFA